MELLSSLFMNVIPFVVVLSILVYVHEMGHYIVARMNGVRVEVFSIGFGPEIFGWNNKNGTRWKVSYIPLGGYVKLASEDEIEGTAKSRKDPGSMMSKTPWQRIAISIAGPAANYLLAIVLLTALYVSVGQRVPLDKVQLGNIISESAAEKAGLRDGDILIAVEGVEKLSIESLQAVISDHGGKPLGMLVSRGGENVRLIATPERNELPSGKIVGRLGVGLAPIVENQPRGFFEGLANAAQDTLTMTTQTLKALGQMILGERSADGLTGPLGIASVTTQMAQQGIMDLIWLGAILSINLGLINLFPVPMLDGGHILFYLIEAVRGKPLHEKAQEVAYRIGFALVMTLILFSTWNDLSRMKIVQKVLALFN